jgi:hypothetical protein
MKKLWTLAVAALVAAAFAASALADVTPPDANPFPGKTVDVMLYVDTVTSSRTVPKPTNVCSQTNIFPQTSRVVFRMWGVESATSKVLTPDNVKYAYIKIAGQPNMKLTFGKHGSTATSPWFWSAAWAIPADYPLGAVAYRVVVKTTSNKFGAFDPTSLAAGSRLTVAPKS